MSSVTCNCEDWKENIKILDSAIIFANTHGATQAPKMANYCMYCGKPLIVQKQKATHIVSVEKVDAEFFKKNLESETVQEASK